MKICITSASPLINSNNCGAVTHLILLGHGLEIATSQSTIGPGEGAQGAYAPVAWQDTMIGWGAEAASAPACVWLERVASDCNWPGGPSSPWPSLQGSGRQRALGPGVAASAKLAARWPRSRSHPRRDRGRLHSRLSRSRASLPPAASLPHPPLPGLPPGLSSGRPLPSALALAELPPLPALPLRPELLAPWGPGVHLALPELPPEVCAPTPPAAVLALQDLPRLPAPAPPPAHLPLPPLPEAAVAATPGPVGARGRPPAARRAASTTAAAAARATLALHPAGAAAPPRALAAPSLSSAAAAAAPAALLLPVAALLTAWLRGGYKPVSPCLDTGRLGRPGQSSTGNKTRMSGLQPRLRRKKVNLALR